jgi:predicted nucleotidyltransferase
VLETPLLVRCAFLFGSSARGDHLPRADCDIATEGPRASSAEWAETLDAPDTARTLILLDIIRLDDAEAGLREETLRSGKLIHQR